MPSMKDILNTNTNQTKPKPKFPGGQYEAIITAYEKLPQFWSKQGKWVECYVPTYKLTRSIDAEDDSNPELAAEQQQLLDEYGDWTDREWTGKYQLKDKPGIWVATFSELNFPFAEITEPKPNEGTEYIDFLENATMRFHHSPVDANDIESGFAHDVLGLEYGKKGATLGQVFEDTVGKSFLITLDWESGVSANTGKEWSSLSITGLARAM